MWIEQRLASSAPGLVWAAVYGMFGLTYYATVVSSRLWVPDTKYYAAVALRVAGHSQDDAARIISAHIRPFGIDWGNPTAADLFGGGLVGPRVVYPVLSAPFVEVFGLRGMAVVPALALVVTIALLLLTLAPRYGWLGSLPVLVLLATSSHVMLFASAMLTDGLAMMWSAMLLFVGLRTHSFRSHGVWLLLAVSVLQAFSRQSTLIPAGAFLVAWLALALRRRTAGNRWAPAALAVGVTTLLTQLLQAVLWPGFSQVQQFEHATHTTSLGAALRRAPRLIRHLANVEFQHLAQSDLSQLLLLAASLIAVVVLWRREEAHLAVGALLGAAVYEVTNGSPTGLRYGLPALPYVALLVAALVARLGTIGSRHALASAPGGGPAAPAGPGAAQSGGRSRHGLRPTPRTALSGAQGRTHDFAVRQARRATATQLSVIAWTCGSRLPTSSAGGRSSV